MNVLPNLDKHYKEIMSVNKRIAFIFQAIIIDQKKFDQANIIKDQLINKFLEINPELIIIEDISHSQGAKIENFFAGTLGVASFMSMQGDKAISAGEGGVGEAVLCGCCSAFIPGDASNVI